MGRLKKRPHKRRWTIGVEYTLSTGSFGNNHSDGHRKVWLWIVLMSGRGIDFLENWVNKNVTAIDRKGSKARAKELAGVCIADAAALGITIDDMEPEWGSVEEIIFDAMQDILGDELVFWKTVAAIRKRREGNETLH